MRHAGLLEGGGNGPNLAAGAGNLGGYFLQNLQPWRVNAVVVCDEDAH